MVLVTGLVDYPALTLRTLGTHNMQVGPGLSGTVTVRTCGSSSDSNFQPLVYQVRACCHDCHVWLLTRSSHVGFMSRLSPVANASIKRLGERHD
jgi:hypothetical protein